MSALPQVIQDPNQPGKFDYIFPSGGLLSVYSDSQADATQQVIVYLATLTHRCRPKRRALLRSSWMPVS